MLTGDTSPTLGDALIRGRSVQERGVVQTAVGYCPQVDALIDQLTGRQHITLYARLRGVPRAKVPGVVEWALRRLDLVEHADKPAGQYSGGNRRRLSAAIALLGAPQLLLLDEPTSGVDPVARQFLWSIIRGVASAGQSVLLTTHSMAECEALCSRVGIMVNGSFCCLGTPQQLKSRYGDGYRLKLRVSGELEPIQEFIRQHFPHSVLKEKHLNNLVYQLPPTGLKLSEAFRDLERGRETLVRDHMTSCDSHVTLGSILKVCKRSCYLM
jgi:ABC-type multidrug transport system ATPase subunit